MWPPARGIRRPPGPGGPACGGLMGRDSIVGRLSCRKGLPGAGAVGVRGSTHATFYVSFHAPGRLDRTSGVPGAGPCPRRVPRRPREPSRSHSGGLLDLSGGLREAFLGLPGAAWVEFRTSGSRVGGILDTKRSRDLPCMKKIEMVTLRFDKMGMRRKKLGWSFRPE